MVTEIKATKLDEGLRILARMIARAYLRDAFSKHSVPSEPEDMQKEENDGNKRCV